jgi:hypothetical protein
MPRYHVIHGDRRTTVSLPRHLAGLLAVHLGHQPDDAEAHRAVRDWLQAQLDAADDPGRQRVSQWLQGEAILAIADKELSSAYLTWLTGVEV